MRVMLFEMGFMIRLYKYKIVIIPKLECGYLTRSCIWWQSCGCVCVVWPVKNIRLMSSMGCSIKVTMWPINLEYTLLLFQSTFDYLHSREGKVIVVFYGQPNRDLINSMDLFMLDPRYFDGRMVLLQIKEIIKIGNNDSWSNQNHEVSYTPIWKER